MEDGARVLRERSHADPEMMNTLTEDDVRADVHS